MSKNADTEIPDALFFGLLEGLSFLCLFLSPLLAPIFSLKIWLAVAVLRVLVLAVRVLPGRTSDASPDRETLSELWKRGWPYQLPFWFASLLFPLGEGQTQAALSALALQLALTVLLWLVAQRNSFLSGESAAYLSYLAWSCLSSPPGWWLGVALAGFALTLRITRREQRRHMSTQQSLAIGTVWLLGWVLPAVSLHPVVHPQLILGWQLIAIFTILLLEHQKQALANAEIETATPMRTSATVWLLQQQVIRRYLGWAALTCLILQTPKRDVFLIALLMLACSKAVFLSARQWLEVNRALWWIASELTLLWALLNLPETQHQAMLVALSVASLALVANWPLTRIHEEAIPTSEVRGSLEVRLREELRELAPKTLMGRILDEFEGSEIEDDLSAAAPTGFRQRLLDRLRKSSDDSEE